MKLLLVRWSDSFGPSPRWQRLDDMPEDFEPLTVDSVGWELSRNDETLVIVPHVTDPDHIHTDQRACGEMVIPVCCIQEEWEIEFV